jgi:hypothetical protein
MTEEERADLASTRQHAVDALCEHFANDVLSVEEFERRVGRVHKAESIRELRELLSDLPKGGLPVARDELTPEAGPSQFPIPPSRIKEKGFMLAALGGVDRSGKWIPARQNFSIALMGGISLDFREALLGPGVTEVWIFTVMGGAEIIVPPGLTVESDGMAILGSFEHREEAIFSTDPDAPILRLRGLAVMGGVDVQIRYPGETNREAKKRRRLDRKKSRRLKDGS